MRFLLPPALGVALFGVVAPAAAQFSADYTAVAGADTGVPVISRIAISGQHVRIDAGRLSMLFDGADDRLIKLLHHRHRWVDLSSKPARAASGPGFDSLPPAQRIAAEQHNAATQAAAARTPSATDRFTITAAGKNEQVDKRECEVFRIDAGERHVQDLCLIDAKALEISDADQATLQRALSAVGKLSARNTVGAFHMLSQAPAGKFPLRIRDYNDNDTPAETADLKSVSHGAPADSEFAIPSAYKQEAAAGGGSAN